MIEMVLVILDWLEVIGVEGEVVMIRYVLNFVLFGGMVVFFKCKILRVSVGMIVENID